MQISYFTCGGYVIHKALDGRCSAWFDADGNIRAAERRDSRDRYQPVKPGSDKWNRLQAVYGKRENFEDWNKPHCLHD